MPRNVAASSGILCSSGQMVNLEKSFVIFCTNVHAQDKKNIEDCLGIKAAVNPGNYLGLLHFGERLNMRLRVLLKTER